jgi:predicted phage-related endonuclease
MSRFLRQVEPIATPDNSPETRRQFIGASELLAACVGDNYASRGALWELKTGRRPPPKENTAMKWGNRLEKWLIEDWAELNCAEVLSTQKRCLWCEDPPLVATLDAIVRLPDGMICPLEAKTTRSRNQELGEEGDEIPLRWVIQAQSQMAAIDATECRFAVLVDQSELRQFRIERDQQVIDRLIERAAEFWRYVKDDTVPPAEWYEVDERLNRHQWIRDPGVSVELPADIAGRWSEYEEAGRQIKTLEERRESLKADVVAALGDANRGLLGDGRELVVSTVNRAGYTVEPKSYVQMRARKAR